MIFLATDCSLQHLSVSDLIGEGIEGWKNSGSLIVFLPASNITWEISKHLLTCFATLSYVLSRTRKESWGPHLPDGHMRLSSAEVIQNCQLSMSNWFATKPFCVQLFCRVEGLVAAVGRLNPSIRGTLLGCLKSPLPSLDLCFYRTWPTVRRSPAFFFSYLNSCCFHHVKFLCLSD